MGTVLGVSVTVRTTSGHVDPWAAIPGETRWVDYAHELAGDELVVYAHTFRRVRDRATATTDVLMWKPDTTRDPHKYGAGEWVALGTPQREWPPAEVQQVPRRRRRGPRSDSSSAT